MLAIVGAGHQARPHIEAMLQARPFEEIRISSRTRESAEKLAADWPDARAVGSNEDAVRGADVILDSIGGQNLIESVAALAYRGTLVSVGVAGRSGSNIEARDLWMKNNALRGVFLGGALIAEYPRVSAMIADLVERVARGELRVHIDRTFQLAEAADAHAYIESRAAFGRVVMSP